MIIFNFLIFYLIDSRTCKKINKSNNSSTNSTPSSSPKPNFLSSSSSSSYYNNNYNRFKTEPRVFESGVTGLYNLGNTCFMNSMLQCLNSCKVLTKYFLNDFTESDINIDNPLGTKGDLSLAYREVLNHMWNVNNKSYCPDNFKRVLSQHCPRFGGYEQQDSHEFMSYLLDGLHEDLNKIKDKPYVPAIENPNNDIPLDKLAEMSWENYEKRNKSVICDIFSGMYKNHLVCPCGNISDIFDPFTSLSLPIPEEEYEVEEIKPINNNNNNRSDSPTSIQQQKQQQQSNIPPLPHIDSLDSDDSPPPLESPEEVDNKNESINKENEKNIYQQRQNKSNNENQTIILIQKVDDDVISFDDDNDNDGYVIYSNYQGEMNKDSIIVYLYIYIILFYNII